MLTEKQPYRCHECGWRKWHEVRVHPESPDVHPEDLRTGRVPQPVSPKDLDSLDAVAPSTTSTSSASISPATSPGTIAP